MVRGCGVICFEGSTFLSVSVSLHLFLPASVISAPLAGVCLSPCCGESRRFCGSLWQCDSGPAHRNLPCYCQARLAGWLRISGPLPLYLSVPASLSILSWTLSPSLFLFDGEWFVSTVTGSSDSGIGEGTLRFRDPSPSPAWH